MIGSRQFHSETFSISQNREKNQEYGEHDGKVLVKSFFVQKITLH